MNETKLTVLWCIGVVFTLFVMISAYGCGHDISEEPQPVSFEFDGPINDILTDEEKPVPIFERYEFLEYGYSSIDEWYNDMREKNAEAAGKSDTAIESYISVITDEEIAELREFEKIMTTTLSASEYNEASSGFDAVVEECNDRLTAPSRTASSNVSSYTGGGFDIPYNFRVMGVLYDSKFRYTYYSSNVLYHYRTPEWTLGSDGIYRDSAGRVVVASDDYPEGTVVYSELFGDCIVLDCGVGRSGTLDVYVGW